MNEGLFVTVEGIDGAGTTTVVDEAENQLPDVMTTAEPAEQYWTGEQVRRSIGSDDSPPATDFHMFMADRAYHIEHTVKPALNAGKTLISDRYLDSTLAYQQEALDGTVEDSKAFIEYNLNQDWVVWPDLTILIDVPAEVAAKRGSRDDDKYEVSDFQKTVRQNYLDIAEDNPRIITVDGEQEKQAVVGECLTIIHEAQVQHAAHQ